MQGFKEFLMKGNLIELAVAFIMGTAFAAVVKAFAGILMDLVGLIFKVPDLSNTPVMGINIGVFLTALIGFIMTALVLYLAVVKPYEAYKKMRGITDEKTATETELLAEIRDLLAGR
ncbi:MscL family protein [Naumannella sp. ID2617S]|uniref:Mechanosensitive ion channel protein MscL n=1 Tax=Enemella dayhoffiae TaxID=2016507 RepID=A0A255HA20_9ACTN|nr:MscL family protein [Enemella dayhoffiae]NNG21284.1 MscL family protein [Naumannella sp. ID2617S]OYO24519.1 mechanosensitive ion channel protein MscL [Enemella dayhoffiae]